MEKTGLHGDPARGTVMHEQQVERKDGGVSGEKRRGDAEIKKNKGGKMEARKGTAVPVRPGGDGRGVGGDWLMRARSLVCRCTSGKERGKMKSHGVSAVGRE